MFSLQGRQTVNADRSIFILRMPAVDELGLAASRGSRRSEACKAPTIPIEFPLHVRNLIVKEGTINSGDAGQEEKKQEVVALGGSLFLHPQAVALLRTREDPC